MDKTLTRETRSAVEKYLNKARDYSITEFIPLEPQTTMSYVPRYHGQTNQVNSQVECIAIHNLAEPERQRLHIERVERAVARLGKKQASVIRLCYLDKDEHLDLEIAMELGYSERHYRRIKQAALLQLAKILGIIQYEEEETILKA